MKLQFSIQDGVLAQALLLAFTRKFCGMSETPWDALMQSFAFKYCLPREGLIP